MGKKRSKTCKQKQARATKRFGGVSVKKGGSSSNKQATPLVLEASKKPRKSHSKKKFSYVKTPLPLVPPPKTPRSNNEEEQSDFNRQLASMEERQWSKMNKSKKKNRGVIKMTPATLLVSNADKTTTELVEEATSGVQALQHLGQQQQQIPKSNNRLQVLAAQQRAAWTRETLEDNKQSQNAFSVLQNESDDDDDDNGWGDDDDVDTKTTRQGAPPLFQFAPPSFGLPNDDVDPDL